MNAKYTIRKILFIAFWLCIGGGMLGLLLAAIGKKNKGNCNGYVITFRDSEKNSFITTENVEELLINAAGGNIKGEPVSSFKLQDLEQLLERNSWIDKAVLYFDNADVLHITVSEKRPVARIFPVTGPSFFIDSLGRRIPLSDQSTARVTVFTGFSGRKDWSAEDSLLIRDITTIANYVARDPLWRAQVTQVDITADGKFEMVPLVGNHLVRMGNAEELDKKFDRLLVFYRQVLSKTGFDRYKTIDVQYRGQVVASRSEGNPKIDSIQLRRNVEKLLKQSFDAEKDTVVKALPAEALQPDPVVEDDPALTIIKPVPVRANESSSTTKPAVVKKNTTVKKKEVKKETKPVTKVEKPKQEEGQPVAEEQKQPVPKAVMPKRVVPDQDN